MSPQQFKILNALKKAEGWTTLTELKSKTGVKSPRTIIKALRDFGHVIIADKPGPNSKGYHYGEPQ